MEAFKEELQMDVEEDMENESVSSKRRLLSFFGPASSNNAAMKPNSSQPLAFMGSISLPDKMPPVKKAAKTPLVFVSWQHCNQGLALAARTALPYNDVVVIGDNTTCSLLPRGVRFFGISSYANGAGDFGSRFAKLYGSAPRFSSLLRVFVLGEWMRRSNTIEAMLVDTDVLYFTNLTELSHSFSDFNFSMPIRAPRISTSALLFKGFVARALSAFITELFLGRKMSAEEVSGLSDERIVKLFLIKIGVDVLRCESLSNPQRCQEDYLSLKTIADRLTLSTPRVEVGNLADPHQAPSGEWRVFGGPGFPLNPRFLHQRSATNSSLAAPTPYTIVRNGKAFYWNKHLGYCLLDGVQFASHQRSEVKHFERTLRDTRHSACLCSSASCSTCEPLEEAKLVVASLWRIKHLPFLEPHNLFYSSFYFSHAIVLVLDLCGDIAWSTVTSRLNDGIGRPHEERLLEMDDPVVKDLKLTKRVSRLGQQVWTIEFRRKTSGTTDNALLLQRILLKALPGSSDTVLFVNPDEFLKPPGLTTLSRDKIRVEWMERVPTSTQFNIVRPMMWRRRATCAMRINTTVRECNLREGTASFPGDEHPELDYTMYVMLVQNATRVSAGALRQSTEDNAIRWVFKRYSQSNVVAAAKLISDRHGLVFFQLFTAGFAAMTKSWVCNVRRIERRDGVSILARTLLIATDEKAYTAMRSFDMSLNVLYEPEPTSTNLHYGHLTYFEYMMFRSELIFNMLKAGVSVWLVESDAVWLEDPTPYAATVSADIVTMSDSLPPHRGVQGGFLLLRPTEMTKRIWEYMLAKLVVVMQDLKDARLKSVGNQGSEQRLLQMYLLKTPDVRVHWLDCNLFVSGLWYKDEGWQKSAPTPVVILNNWIAGNQSKVKRSRKWGHWFLSGGEDRCLGEKVSRNGGSAEVQGGVPIEGGSEAHGDSAQAALQDLQPPSKPPGASQKPQPPEPGASATPAQVRRVRRRRAEGADAKREEKRARSQDSGGRDAKRGEKGA